MAATTYKKTTSPRGRSGLRADYDVRVLVIVLCLMGIGVSLVASSSSFFAGGIFSDHFELMRRHVGRVVIAVLILVLAMRIDYRIYRKLSPMFLIVGIALVAGLFLFGKTIREVERWYYLSMLRIAVQPADLARLALIFFLSYWMTRTGHALSEFKRGFLPAAVAVTVVVGLIAATPNYGTATATLLIAVIMLFIGGARLTHLAGFGVALAAVAAFKMVRHPYVMERIAGFMDRGGATSDANWQVTQSLIAMGSGGLFGVGFGGSEQKLSWLPDSYTDFIFAILGEEAGLVGTFAVSALFLLLALRALKISRRCSDRFGEMLVIGIGCSIFMYAMLNMMVATGLAPVTGLPLPFLSYGGSALVVNAFAVGVLLNVSRTARRPAGEQVRRNAVLRTVRA